MLLLGEAGAGKSAFGHHLESQLWEKYQAGARIPLFIDLSDIKHPEHDLITQQLRREGLTEPQIQALKKQREFVLICDGYDTMQQSVNLYRGHRLNQPGKWQGQMIVSCRSEYFGRHYQDANYWKAFQPGTQHGISTLFQAIVIAPFSADNIQDYLQAYVKDIKASPSNLRLGQYQQILYQNPHLKELVRNPLLLNIAVDVLPRLSKSGHKLYADNITRLALYDQFVEQWFEDAEKRLSNEELTEQEKRVFERLKQDGFTRHALDFTKKLAGALYEKNNRCSTVKYFSSEDKETWKKDFFGSDPETQVLLKACPLSHSGTRYRFLDQSLFEYFVARAIFDPQEIVVPLERAEDIKDMSSRQRRNSNSSTYSFESQDEAINPEQKAREVNLPDSLLGRKSLIQSPPIIAFLAERVRQSPGLEQLLWEVIERARNIKQTDSDENRGEGEFNKVRKAAANAGTVLVKAEVVFSDKKLSYVAWPGINAESGNFDHAICQGADFRKANLVSAWLRNADFSKLDNGQLTKMHRVNFGELSALPLQDAVYSCCCSPDISRLLMTTGQYIAVYETEAFKHQHTLIGHKGDVLSAMFSLDGNKIVSGDKNGEIRLWSVRDGRCLAEFQAHSGAVLSVAIFSDGGIVSGGQDGQVKVWENGSAPFVLKDHQQAVSSVAIVPESDKIISGSWDGTVKVWSTALRERINTFKGHNGPVLHIAVSPDGKRVASAGQDKTVKVWPLEGQKPLYTLEGHTDWVTSVVFSPNGKTLASCSFDRTVRLWSVDGSDDQPPQQTIWQYLSGWQKEDATNSRSLATNREPCGAVLSAAIYIGPQQGSWWLMTGEVDKIIRVWEIQTQGSIQLHWTSLPEGQKTLNVQEMNIEGVEGLTEKQIALLLQRGAKGAPQGAPKNKSAEQSIEHRTVISVKTPSLLSFPPVPVQLDETPGDNSPLTLQNLA